MREGRVTDCYAWAKQPLRPGDSIEHGIGCDQVYGMIMNAGDADAAGYVPQGLLHFEDGAGAARLRSAIDADVPLHWDDLKFPESRLLSLWKEQCALLRSHPVPAAA